MSSLILQGDNWSLFADPIFYSPIDDSVDLEQCDICLEYSTNYKLKLNPFNTNSMMHICADCQKLKDNDILE